MKARRLLTFVCLFVLSWAAASRVQAQTAKDALAGSWGHDGVPMLELKLDGKSGVTGTAIWRGDGMELRTPIRTGTFDPSKGAFKLEGEGRTPGMDAPSAFVIEGTVTGESMTGRFRFGDRAGDFTFTRLQQPSGGTRHQPDRFSWTADRSSDDGQTWEKEYEQIEAHRIGAARTLPPLTTVRKLP